MRSFPRVATSGLAGTLLALLFVARGVLFAQPPSCGDTTVDPGEQCDPPGSSCSGALAGPSQADCPCPPSGSHVRCSDFQSPPSFTRLRLGHVDQFGASPGDITKAETLCAPANKNGEDPTAPADPRHLAG